MKIWYERFQLQHVELGVWLQHPQHQQEQQGSQVQGVYYTECPDYTSRMRAERNLSYFHWKI